MRPNDPTPYVRINITDNGHGMDAATQQRIFDPFFTTKPVGRGAGLGLSTAYGIVQEHKGWIDCSSHPDKVTTFAVYLPGYEAEVETNQPPEQKLVKKRQPTITQRYKVQNTLHIATLR
jgi:two-component system cell cycle sensor histidine kinase/response regulator CckA